MLRYENNVLKSSTMQDSTVMASQSIVLPAGTAINKKALIRKYVIHNIYNLWRKDNTPHVQCDAKSIWLTNMFAAFSSIRMACTMFSINYLVNINVANMLFVHMYAVCINYKYFKCLSLTIFICMPNRNVMEWTIPKNMI